MEDSGNDSGGGNPTANSGDLSSPREQDRLLPIANVSRIMKKALPANAKISKDAKETVQECVSEFISFVTGEASDKCQREKRKTINGDDLLWAMTTLGFEEYVEPLKVYLQRFREMEGERTAAGVRERDTQEEIGGGGGGVGSVDVNGSGVGMVGYLYGSGSGGFHQMGGPGHIGPVANMVRPR
ncbi:nuclear transcription factor Y subunit B-7 [Tripterygium wilfordii]|uniref:Nuclear transcription factor Y subunit B-7 n=1 Tax=Tripterygium wilfordii TaxID=458696 RepID=A0A7J7C9D9_TRIWF|nr:nuclear transcription factor Y subunit B-3-like [Tripterygium wilfordii]KAF5730477.1 nuclear transcription factor Y subunit B-7 [Tripterygium wilfordii]